MKQLLFLISFGLMLHTSYAQNNGAEAKAAYLLAEEQFNAGKYETCVSYLDDAVKSLGNPNSKILYLKIMAQRELAKKDTGYVSKLMATIDAFEKASDVASFNEEKYLEVTKLKLFIKKQGIEERTPEELAAARFTNYGIDGFRPGQSIEELKKTKPDYFVRATKSTSNGMETYHSLYDSVYHNMLFVKNNRVFSVFKSLFLYEDEDAGFSKTTAFIDNFIKGLGFNFDPVKTVKEEKGKGVRSIVTTYEWQLDKKTVTLEFKKSIYKKSNGAHGSIDITDKSVLSPN